MLPNMALFNHACQPNAAFVQIGPVEECNFCIVVIARDGVASGQEVVVCYNSELMFTHFEARRRQLMTTWNFLCRCSRCESEKTEDPDAEETPLNDDDEEHKQLTSSEEA